ncbi:MAG: anaerobic ribonucleoside-triphosphate reductase activating protein [Micropruina sp.]
MGCDRPAPVRQAPARQAPARHPGPDPDPRLEIAGLTALSTCDWPGRLVATVFLQGCPWRCGYCHNPELLDPRTPGRVPWPRVIDLLRRRRGLLDGLVFSGGEPTRQPGLATAMEVVRELGFGVGLHTAGAYPGRLAAVLPLVDWVGLDVKALPDGYPAVTGIGSGADKAFASLRLVLDAGVEHEVRVSVDPALHTEGGVWRLVELLTRSGVRRIVLQQVRRPDGSASAPLPVLIAPPRGVRVRRAE